MYQSSEEAMEANEAISFEAGERELLKHSMLVRRADKPGHIDVWDGFQMLGGVHPAWDTIPCTTKAILQWLGY